MPTRRLPWILAALLATSTLLVGAPGATADHADEAPAPASHGNGTHNGTNATFLVDLSPPFVSALPGSNVTFNVTVTSGEARDVHLNASVGNGTAPWHHEFGATNLSVSANGSAATTLVVHVPADAQRGRSYDVTVFATDVATGRQVQDTATIAIPCPPLPGGLLCLLGFG